MRHLVINGTAKHKVSLPEQVSGSEIFNLSVGEKKLQARWYKNKGVLSVLSQSGVEQLLRVRRAYVTRGDGDQHTEVRLEAYAFGKMHLFKANILPDIPGQDARSRSNGHKELTIKSQITGRVIKVHVKVGDKVSSGDVLMVIEAMKMENKIFAQNDGKISSVTVKEGDSVQTGKLLIKFAQDTAP